MPIENILVRRPILTRQVAEKLKAILQSGRTGLSDVILSERDLAKSYGVSRDTVRKALAQLVNEGYLASVPRHGYRVLAPVKADPASATVAFVQGGSRQPWEFTSFNLNLLNAFQHRAISSNRELMALAIGKRSPEDLAQGLLSKRVAGAIVDADDANIACAVQKAGLATVLVDNASPSLHSVMQDNTSGAYQAVRRLVERGHRRIAFAGRFIGSLHGTERLGGFLAAMAQAGLPVPKEWCLLSEGENRPGRALVELARSRGGPTAVALLWPEFLEDMGEALVETDAGLDLVVWWGATPERRAWWKQRFPQLPVPDGMRWEVDEMAQVAMARLDEQLLEARICPARSLVPVRLVEGEPPPEPLS